MNVDKAVDEILERIQNQDVETPSNRTCEECGKEYVPLLGNPFICGECHSDKNDTSDNQ